MTRNAWIVAALALLLSASVAVAAVFNIRQTRTVLAETVGTGVSSVCLVNTSAPDVLLSPCVAVDAAAPGGVTVSFDVTAFLLPGTRQCFKAVAVSPEGLQSLPSADEACGTMPAQPKIK